MTYPILHKILKDHFGKTMLESKAWHSCVYDEKKFKVYDLERLRKVQVKFQGVKIKQKWSNLKVIANFVHLTLSGLEWIL